MTAAIIIEERQSGELVVFRSTEEAESYLEAIDVEDEEYEAFDSNGIPFALSVEADRVKVSRVIGAEPTKEETEGELRRMVGDDASSLPIEEVIRIAQQRSRGWLDRLLGVFRKNEKA